MSARLRGSRRLVWLLAVVTTVVTVAVVARSVDVEALRQAWAAAAARPASVLAVLAVYAGAFVLRAVAWRRVVPRLGLGHALAALHVSLAGNHVLPARLGEPLRVTSVVRRAGLPLDVAVASTVTLRAADLVAVAGLAAVFGAPIATDLLGIGLVAVLALGGAAAGAGLWWSGRLARAGAGLRRLDTRVAALTVMSWVAESAVVWQAAAWAGAPISPADAVAVTAIVIAAQVAALAPGGLGTYEAAATGALVALGVPAATGLAIAVTAHAVKTAYALGAGAVALAVPAPGLLGRLRLPRHRPPATTGARPAGDDRPVVLLLPAHDEAATIAAVVRRAPRTVAGHPVEVLVVDDGSTDATAAEASAAGATVARDPVNRGLGAAVRRGFGEALARAPAAIAFCDADGEYAPEELARLVTPILDDAADYVVGTRFGGHIERMLPHRRLGNIVLTVALRWIAREPITDGQSGYRALSPAAAAAAEIIHDYNYAQVLSLDLVGKGFRYAEVPISYRFREQGRSFVRLGRYLRAVVPAVHRELNTT